MLQILPTVTEPKSVEELLQIYNGSAELVLNMSAKGMIPWNNDWPLQFMLKVVYKQNLILMKGHL